MENPLINYIKNVLCKIKAKDEVNVADLESLLIQTYKLLDSNDSAAHHLCVAAISHVADRNFDDKMIQQLLRDNIAKLFL